METSTKVKIVAIVAVVASPFLTYFGHQDKERLATLEKEGITVNATLQDGESHKSGRRSRSYNMNATFTPEGGAPVTKTFPVTSGFFSAHAQDGFIKDPEVQVRYLKKDVQGSAIILNGSTDETFLFPSGIGAFGLGSLTLLGMFMMKKK